MVNLHTSSILELDSTPGINPLPTHYFTIIQDRFGKTLFH